jgi:hypothetical protein
LAPRCTEAHQVSNAGLRTAGAAVAFTIEGSAPLVGSLIGSTCTGTGRYWQTGFV